MNANLLRESVWEHLDRITAMAPASVDAVELVRLASTWRRTLRAHEADRNGNCPVCSTEWHRCLAPCPVWQAAHDHLVSGGLAPVQQRGTLLQSA